MPTVSWSEIKLFRKCMKAHNYRYVQRYQRKKKAVPLLKGSILHDMLDAHFQVNNIIPAKGKKLVPPKDAGTVLDEYEEKYDKLFKEEQDEYGDIINDCAQIFGNYLTYYKDDPLTYEASEVFVSTQLAEGITLIGYIDKIATDAQGRRWLIDHKFVKNIPGESEMYHELQLLLYVWMWERFIHGGDGKIKIDGIMWDHARTKLPTVPKVLKNGSLSTAKNIDTTASVFMREIAKQGLDPADYADFLEDLKGREDKFFRRITLPRPNQHMIDDVVGDFRDSAIMIQNLQGVTAPRNMTNMNCRMCEFRSICEAEVRGQDAKFVIKAEYEIRERFGDKSDASQEEDD